MRDPNPTLRLRPETFHALWWSWLNLLMRMLLLVASAAIACGPSREKVAAERAALVALADERIKVARQGHACDEYRRASRAALDASLEASRAALKTMRYTHDTSYDEYQSSEAKLKVCEALLPTWQERLAKVTTLHDGWMDACLECATGRACVDAERKMRGKEQLKELAAEIAVLEGMKNATVCDKRLAR